MIHLRDRRSVWSLIIALLVLQLGCAGKVQRLPQPPSIKARVRLGSIGVVSVQFVPEVEILAPLKGWTGGCENGAAKATDALWSFTPSGQAGFFACALTPLVALGGCIYGAIEAPPATKVKMAQEDLNKYVHADIEIQEKMRDQFLQFAREQTHYAFVVLEDQGPATPGEKLSYGSLADHGIDTVIEIEVQHFGLKGGWTESNPLLKFFMTLRTKLIRIGDGEVVYVATLEYESVESHKFDAWTANEAQLFKEELGPCYETLVEKIVEEVFLLYLPS